MPLLGSYRARMGRGHGIGSGTDLILPRVGPFANASPVLVASLSNVTIADNTVITRTGTPTSPDKAATFTISGPSANLDIGTHGGYYVWCHKFINNALLTYGQSAQFPNGSSASAGVAGAGSSGAFGGGSGAAANTTVGTYTGGAPGTGSHVNGFQGQVADGYTTGAGGTGVAIANVLPSNYSLQSALPKSGKGGNVTIGAFTSGAGGGGGACPGIICIVCNIFQYDKNNCYFAMVGTAGLSGNGAGNGGDAGDSGVMIFMAKAKVSSGGDIGPPNYNFDPSIEVGGAGGVHGSAGRNGHLGLFQFWEITRDNRLIYHWNPNDTWNNL